MCPSSIPMNCWHAHRKVLETLNSPEIFFERCRTHYAHRARKPIPSMPIGWTELRAGFRSFWHQGVVGNYRWTFWKFMAYMLAHHPRDFGDAIRISIHGLHLILTTRDALQVDEVQTFLDEALDHPEAI